jgi:hypothetical protein
MAGAEGQICRNSVERSRKEQDRLPIKRELHLVPQVQRYY